MLSLPLDNGFVKSRRSITECKAAANNFIKRMRQRKPYILDVWCAVCRQNTLVMSDIVHISETGLCGYCDRVKPASNFVSEGKSYCVEDVANDLT